ncbi:ParA family protein [Lactococcus taiwanensis]|uniref:ParA family protein n=1 Tax=Lactococcus taiwanensis TaxID=1151742 RepID=UPI0035190A6B
MEEEKFPIVLTAALPAGGTGKTPFVRVYGEWKARQGYKVALIDLDHQCSLSELYDVYETEYTSLNLFRGEAVNFISVGENIWLLPSHPNLQYEPARLRAQGTQNVYFLLEDWLYEHEEEVKQFDYLLIDTHPDTDTLTKNALAVSTAQIGVVMPTEKSTNAIPKAEQALADLKAVTYDKRHQEERVTCEMLLMGTDIEKIGRNYTKLSQQLLALISEDERFVGYIPHKELFAQAFSDEKSSIWEQLENKNLLKEATHRNFRRQLEEVMTKMDKKVEKMIWH